MSNKPLFLRVVLTETVFPVAVHFDSLSQQLCIRFNNNYSLGVPATMFADALDCVDTAFQDIGLAANPWHLVLNGNPGISIDVERLLFGLTPLKTAKAIVGFHRGSMTSSKKSAAARNNGAKGGRPSKHKRLSSLDVDNTE